ncbi:MAG: HEXXH motif-containing putative peptide modification protein [Acidobacteriota bacterium]
MDPSTTGLAQARHDPPSTTLSGFSCPQEPFDHELRETIIRTYHQELWKIFHREHRGALEDRAPSLVGAVDGDLPRADYETLWDRSLGRLHPSRRQDVDPASVVAGVGLRLLERERRRDTAWSCRLTAPVCLRFSRFLLPPARELSVEACGDSLELGLDGGRLRFERRAGRWQDTSETSAAGGKTVTELAVVEMAGREILVVTADLPLDGGVLDGTLRREDLDRDALQRAVSEAMSLLGENCPDYVGWIREVLRGLAPLIPVPNRMHSGTHKGWPGIITTSLNVSAPALAEILVHECSHQYFQQLRWLSPVHDRNDRTEYFSPVKGRPRPIDKILLAYHAFANVLIMNRTLLDRGAGGDYCRRNQEQLGDQLSTLGLALEKSSALTEFGRALFEPLVPRVAAAL